MMHMSNALGVNCTYCHNTPLVLRLGPEQPGADHGLVRHPHGARPQRRTTSSRCGRSSRTHRLGPLGDAPKANCATCHQGAYKPLYGASMLKDYPELGPSGQAGTTSAPQ